MVRLVLCCWALFLVASPILGANETEWQRHVTFSDAKVAGKRVLVVGDVHGCHREMLELLRKANVLNSGGGLKDDAMVIFVGDLVQKAPDSCQVLNFVRTTENVYSVRGNHEDNCLGPEAEDKCLWLRDCPSEDVNVMKTFPYTISIPKYDAHIVHAGLLPTVKKLEDQRVFTMTNMVNIEIQSDGTMIPWETSVIGHNWAKVWSQYQSEKHVYYGHDYGRGKTGPQRYDYATGLDSGCFRGGLLNGVIMPAQDEKFYDVLCGDYRFTNDD